MPRHWIQCLHSRIHVPICWIESSRCPMSNSLPAIVGGVAGGVAVLIVAIVLLCFRCLRCSSPANRNSETGSSDPSTLAEWNRGDRVSSAGAGFATEHQGAREFTLQELKEATKNFNDSNLVGSGSFGLVYKGLLLDGTIVAIKRRASPPNQEFVEEVKKLSEILHRNLVSLIGYCQDGGLQMIVFQYLPNGSISNHLCQTGSDSNTRLEFKQRLSVAIGAAKGLSHLHSLVPPLIHKNFKTSNVLVDENFIAKVADAGILRLAQGNGDVGSSQLSRINVFQDPEIGEMGALTEAGDVYSFGVFLLELISGVEVASLSPNANNHIAQWVEAHMCSEDLMDRRLGSGFTSEGMKELIRLTLQCLYTSAQGRPKMRTVVAELERILETEMTLTTVMGDGTTIVTLGSQLFTS